MGVAKKKEINIEQLIKKTAQETVKELEKARLIKNEGTTYFQKTEKLLYSYPSLLKALDQKKQDIKFIQQYGLQEKSTSIVLYSTGGSKSKEEQHVELLDAYKASKERTERLIRKIQRALKTIEKDEYYELIELKYFNTKKLNNTEIAEKLNSSDRTIRRHKNRLVNQVQVLIFGADGLE